MNNFWRPDVRPEHEPHKVLILRGVKTDAARQGRAVPYKIYYPADHSYGYLPVVIWSHGLGGGREGAGFLARFIAAHGYVVVHVQHAGSDTGLWEGKPGHPWDAIRAAHVSRRATLARFRDVPFIMDELPGIFAEHEGLSRADISRAGMSGHSFGAITAQVMAGQRLGRGRRMYSLRDARFHAAIAYSPSPAYNRSEDPAKIYGGIAIPMFFMTGTDDGSPVSGRDYTHRLPIWEYAGSPEKHFLLLEGGDHMVFTGSRGQLGENPKRAAHENIIRMAALAFWDAYLKDDADAKEWLSGGGFARWIAHEARYEFKKNNHE